MFHSLLDNFWLVATILVVLAAFTGLKFKRTGQPRWAGGVGIILVLLVGLIIANRMIESPTEQVSKLLAELVQAALEQKPEVIVQAISPRYNHDGKTFDQLAGLIRARLTEFKPDSISLNGLEVKATGQTATAGFVTALSGKYSGHEIHHFVRLKVGFRLEGERWKIESVDRYEVVGGTGGEIPLDQLR